MWFDLGQSDDTNIVFGNLHEGAVAFINYYGDDNRLLPLLNNPIQLKTGEVTFLKLVLKEVRNYSYFQI